MAPVPNPSNGAYTQNLGGVRFGSGNPGGVLATPFSLTSGGSNRRLINYVGKNVINHWKESTAKKKEKLYKCTPEMFYHFIKILKVSSKFYGCTNVGGSFLVKTNYHQRLQAQNIINDFDSMN